MGNVVPREQTLGPTMISEFRRMIHTERRGRDLFRMARRQRAQGSGDTVDRWANDFLALSAEARSVFDSVTSTLRAEGLPDPDAAGEAMLNMADVTLNGLAWVRRRAGPGYNRSAELDTAIRWWRRAAHRIRRGWPWGVDAMLKASESEPAESEFAEDIIRGLQAGDPADNPASHRES
jgi:hypothetical protein